MNVINVRETEERNNFNITLNNYNNNNNYK